MNICLEEQEAEKASRELSPIVHVCTCGLKSVILISPPGQAVPWVGWSSRACINILYYVILDIHKRINITEVKQNNNERPHDPSEILDLY